MPSNHGLTRRADRRDGARQCCWRYPGSETTGFAVPIRSRVMSLLLGIPGQDAECFDKTTAGIMQAADATSAQEAGGSWVKIGRRL